MRTTFVLFLFRLCFFSLFLLCSIFTLILFSISIGFLLGSLCRLLHSLRCTLCCTLCSFFRLCRSLCSFSSAIRFSCLARHTLSNFKELVATL